MEETNGLTGRINEFANLLEQLGDIDIKRDAGLIDNEAYIECKAKKFAYTAAIERLSNGEPVDDEAFDEILEHMREVASEPTQVEINEANIAFLLMMEGD